jgi:DNA-binding beta-propeller fold protein YncE
MRFSVLLVAILAYSEPAESADFQPPAGERYARVTASGSILPGGRIVQPLGKQFETGPGAFGLAISPGGTAATADIGSEQFGATVIERVRIGKGEDFWQNRQIHARTPAMKAPESADPEWKGVFFGIAFETEKSIWISEGDSGRLRLIDISSGTRRKVVDLNQSPWANSFTSDLALDPIRHLLFVVDQANFRVAVVDSRKGQVVSSVRVGRMPFAITLSPDGNTAYVTNAGVFQYQLLPGAKREDARRTGLAFPAFGFPSSESLQGVKRETEAGVIDVPPLGDPNVRESNSVCVIDARDPVKPAVTDWIRTGAPFDPKTFGGSAPAGVLATSGQVFVSNAHDDSITVISAPDRKVVAEIPLRIPGLEPFRGIMPAGLAFDPVTKWLLVAEAGINALAVIDTAANELIGHIPVGWLPVRVGIAGDRVYVANARGRGTGPNLRRPLMELGEPPDLHHGSVSTFIMPGKSELPKLTATVFAANGFVAAAPSNALVKPKPLNAIRYVVLIVKENRTFDEVLGDIRRAPQGQGGNLRVQAVPQLARFGMHGLADGKKKRFSVQDAAITPNQHALALGGAFSDNFYADADVSVDGHHWLVGAYPDLLTESGLLAAYGGQRQFVLNGASPGRLLFAGTDASVHPDEQPEAGTLWHHLERHGITFRNFGEGFELAGVVEEKGEEPTGARFLTNVPMPDPLYRNTSRDYPGFNMNIPDQYRADRLIAEIEQRYGAGPDRAGQHGDAKQPLPQFIFIHLPNDHMAPERPEDGYPYEASYVEDNDLALGRIIEYLSHTPWWREMAIFVTEDDALGGLDHVDAHRTVLLAAGPYVRRNYVSHTNTSFPGLLKTIFELLNLPPLNLMDATAASLRDIFTTDPDFTPFDVSIPDKRVFDAGAVKTGKAPPVKMDR